MKGIISTDKTTLEAINKKINDYMISNINGYDGIQWGEIFKHPTIEKWVLVINDDERLPLNGLSNSENLNVSEIDSNEWFSSTD